MCGSVDDLCLDHILSVKKGGRSDLENLRVLCRSCNTKEGHKERDLIPKLQKTRDYMKKWRENHPGYFTEKTKEFTKDHRGYWNNSSKEYRLLYSLAKI